MDVQYFEIKDAPGRYFTCAAFTMTLAETRCAAMWREASAAAREPGYRLEHCRNCEIGASHAGETITRDNQYYGSHLCCRCHTWARRIVHGSVCPSCYNREREVARGLNAKGSPPSPSEWFWGDPAQTRGKAKTARLHQVPLNYRINARARERQAPVVNALEGVLAVLRQEKGRIAFARPIRDTVRGAHQLFLFGSYAQR